MRIARRLLPLAAAAALTVVAAGPAVAHVTVNPSEAPQGGFAELTFRVPTERDDANTNKLEVVFPTDTPITSARVRPVPGWKADIQEAALPQPVQTEDGEITEAISRIVWEGGSIGPDEYENFSISAGPLPENADRVVFKAIQSYDSGEVVSWIEEPVEGAEEPEHPAPVLTLTPAAEGEDAHGAPRDEAATNGDGSGTAAAEVATQAEVDSARRTGAIGVGAGVLGLVTGVVALVLAATARRRSGSGSA